MQHHQRLRRPAVGGALDPGGPDQRHADTGPRHRHPQGVGDGFHGVRAGVEAAFVPPSTVLIDGRATLAVQPDDAARASVRATTCRRPRAGLSRPVMA